MADLDLNKFDEEKFEEDEDYQDAVRSTPAGAAVELLATSMTLQDCGEFIALVDAKLLPKFFAWAEKNYPELDIDPAEAVKLIKEAVEADDISIERP